MKKIITTVATILLVATMWAQAPEKMSYQAIIRNTSNNLVTNQGVGIQVSILKGGASGTAVFVETHNATTNINGLVTLEIGTGTLVSGDFTTIDWGADTYFIQTETDPTTAGGTNYTITGTTQLMSVPYALHAKTAENVTGTVNYTETDPTFTAWDKSSGIVITESQISDLTHTVDTDTHIDSVGIVALGFNAGGIVTEVDGSVTNEIQVLSKSGSMVSLSIGGGSFIDAVDDNDNDPLNELQTLSKVLDIVTLSNTGGSFSVNDADADPLNELQDISLSGNNLSITNGSIVNLSSIGFDGDFNNLTNVPVNLDVDYTDDFDGQYSSLTGAPTNVSAFTNDAGYLTSFTETDPTFTASPAAGITNTLMNNWSIAYTWGNHANAGYLTSFTEVDGSVTNELQNLTVSGNNLTISGGNTVTLPTNTSPWTISGSNIYRTGTGKVGINTSTPLATLDVDGDIRGTSFKLLNVGNVGNRFKIGTNANGIDTDIEYATGWLTFMPNPANVAFALDNNGNAIMGLGTNKVGVGTTAPTEKLEVNGSIKITDGTQGVGKVLTSDVNGKATWKRPVDNVITTPVITRGALPVGSSCPPGGNYTAAGSVLEPGVYMYTLYSCSGQIGQVVSGFNISIVFLSGTGDATGTWHNFNMGDCGNYYTGVVRVTSTSNVAVRYSSHGGSSFTVPGANAEQVVYIKIN